MNRRQKPNLNCNYTPGKIVVVTKKAMKILNC